MFPVTRFASVDGMQSSRISSEECGRLSCTVSLMRESYNVCVVFKQLRSLGMDGILLR